jgi:hypothetical protein
MMSMQIPVLFDRYPSRANLLYFIVRDSLFAG